MTTRHAEIREWARENGIEVTARGRLSAAVIAEYDRAHALPEDKPVKPGTELAARVAAPALFAEADDMVERELANQGKLGMSPLAPGEVRAYPFAHWITMRNRLASLLINVLPQLSELEVRDVAEAALADGWVHERTSS
jgi:hypothetical protein